ncbi:MAG: hypothetical protein IIB33_02075 [Chloroflexi bacterium]|nr:hypothetical protein [Chloroflexota bacterium]
MSDFALDYLAFVFASAVGVIMAATTRAGLDGLLITGRRLSYLVALALIGGSTWWFFASEPRNVPDTGLGLDGNEQAVLFVLGAGAALVLMLIVSSLRNWSMEAEASEEYGLDALRNGGYLRTLYRSLRRRRGH